MKIQNYFILILFLFFWRPSNCTAAGHILIDISEISEKQIDSLADWLTPEKNILEAGICLDNKLLLLRLEIKDDAKIQEIFSILKSHGVMVFYLKENISIERFYQNCNTYLSFP